MLASKTRALGGDAARVFEEEKVQVDDQDCKAHQEGLPANAGAHGEPRIRPLRCERKGQLGIAPQEPIFQC